jgi:hypothetical protein
VLAITTQDTSGRTYLLITNASAGDITVDANFSALLSSQTGTMRLFDDTHNNTIVGNPTLSGGHVNVDVPQQAAVLLQF